MTIRRFPVMLLCLLFCLLAYASLALADDNPRFNRNSLDLAFMGGSAQPEVLRGASLSAGSAELAFTWRNDRGGSIGIIGQSIALGTLDKQGNDGQNYDGGGVGLRVGYEWNRVSIFGSGMIGSLEEEHRRWSRDDDAFNRNKYERYNIAGIGGGVGFAILRTSNVDLKVIASADVLGLERNHEDAALGRRLLRQQIGIRLDIYGIGDGVSTPGQFYCFGCGNALYDTGDLFFRGGALLGRAVSTGLFNGLRLLR